MEVFPESMVKDWDWAMRYNMLAMLLFYSQQDTEGHPSAIPATVQVFLDDVLDEVPDGKGRLFSGIRTEVAGSASGTGGSQVDVANIALLTGISRTVAATHAAVVQSQHHSSDAARLERIEGRLVQLQSNQEEIKGMLRQVLSSDGVPPAASSGSAAIEAPPAPPAAAAPAAPPRKLSRKLKNLRDYWDEYQHGKGNTKAARLWGKEDIKNDKKIYYRRVNLWNLMRKYIRTEDGGDQGPFQFEADTAISIIRGEHGGSRPDEATVTQIINNIIIRRRQLEQEDRLAGRIA